MIDGILCTCYGCGEDVPFDMILSNHIEGHMVHVPWECSGCGEGGCYHMMRTDWDAVMDTLGVKFGREAAGFLTRDERTMIRFRNQLESIDSPSDCEAAWTKV